MNTLPYEIKIIIISNLNIDDLHSIRIINKEFYKICDDEFISSIYLKRKFFVNDVPYYISYKKKELYMIYEKIFNILKDNNVSVTFRFFQALTYFLNEDIKLNDKLIEHIMKHVSIIASQGCDIFGFCDIFLMIHIYLIKEEEEGDELNVEKINTVRNYLLDKFNDVPILNELFTKDKTYANKLNKYINNNIKYITPNGIINIEWDIDRLYRWIYDYDVVTNLKNKLYIKRDLKNDLIVKSIERHNHVIGWVEDIAAVIDNLIRGRWKSFLSEKINQDDLRIDIEQIFYSYFEDFGY